LDLVVNFMLPELYRQHCQQFRRLVEPLTTMVNPLSTDQTALKAGLQELQKFFKQELTAPDGDGPALEADGQVRALWVEVDKQLRLLAMDITFLQSARQPVTRSQRQGQIGDRLNRLLRYCDGLLGEDMRE
jgi:hypothetical protein